ncbi:MAG: mandelate racemase/muconate lactonizing enzyme family protein [Reyranellaceae bacterium]
MIIDRIDPIALKVPFQRPGGTDALHLVLCRVTAQGLVGYGECLCLRPTLQRSLMATIRDAIAPLYLGKQVEDRERLNRDVRLRLTAFGRSGTNNNALAAVDTALWDIAGKAAGQPLHALLGGAQRGTVPVMASLDRYNDARAVTSRIERALADKVAAVKVHEFDLDIIECARTLLGPAMPFVADCNHVHTPGDIQASLARWQALNLLFLEDPAWPPETWLDSPKLPQVVIGLGADLGSAEQLAVYGKAPAVGVLQPDVCMIGGVTEKRRAIGMIEPLGVSIAPHSPFIGPAGLATLHFLATMKETTCYAVVEAEPHMDMYGNGLVRWQPELTVPTAPGLGFDPDPGYLKRHAIEL